MLTGAWPGARRGQVQELGLIPGVLVVVADRVEEIFRQAQGFVGPVDVEAFVVIVVPLHGEGVGHDDGNHRDEPQRLLKLAFHIAGLRGVVIGVEGQDGTAQLVHHVPGGAAEDHIFREVVGQGPVGGHDLVKLLQLLFGG